MALQSEMAATLQHHHTNGVLVSSAASPTPSIDSLTGMVVASNGTNATFSGVVAAYRQRLAVAHAD